MHTSWLKFSYFVAEIGLHYDIDMAMQSSVACRSRIDKSVLFGGNMRLRSLVVSMGAIILSGCGVAYVPSDISGAGEMVDVAVIRMSPDTVMQANSMPFTPRALPAAFSSVASGTLPRNETRLPSPIFEPEIRPTTMERRLPPPVDQGAYRIGVGDVVSLATPTAQTNVQELAGSAAARNTFQNYTVQEDGAISIPDIGRVMIGDLTVADAENAIFERFVDARREPSFALEISEFNSQSVTISGQVATPTIISLTITPLYLSQALALAGGPSNSDLTYTVARLLRDGNVYQIPINDLYAYDGSDSVRLIDGDSIFIDSEYDFDRAQDFFEEQVTRAQYTRQTRIDTLQELRSQIALQRAALEQQRTNFQQRLELGAENYDYAYLIGEVRHPGRFALPFENRATLADALFEAGGVREATGNPRQIYVLRGQDGASADETVHAYHLDGANAVNYVLATRFELRPRDIIFVAEQPVTRWNRTITQILPSLSAGQQVSGIAN